MSRLLVPMVLTVLASLPVSALRSQQEGNTTTLTLECQHHDEAGYSLTAEQGDTIWCTVTCNTTNPTALVSNMNGTRLANREVMVYPFLNGTQWGAQANLVPFATEGAMTALSASVAFPLPRRGINVISVALVANLGTGATIGMSMARLTHEGLLKHKQTNAATTVHIVSRRNPSEDYLTWGRNRKGKTREEQAEEEEMGHTVMYWEPWYGPRTARWYSGYWSQAEAIPLVGQYASLNTSTEDKSEVAERNRDVIRQHCIWWAMAGVTAIGIDWTNNVWEPVGNWSSRDSWAQTIYNSTLYSIQFMHQLREEGEYPVPKFSILLGLNNGANTNYTLIGDEIRYLYDDYFGPNAAVPLSDMGMLLHGKPTLLVLDNFDPQGLTHNFTHLIGGNASLGNFTVQFMSTQLQLASKQVLIQRGWGSWMDGVLRPPATPFPFEPGSTGDKKSVTEKKEEEEEEADHRHLGNRSSSSMWDSYAMTITNGFFANGGWLGPSANGTANGATFLMEADWALAKKPKLLFICQWNEFKGYPTNFPGQNHADIYNATLMNDMEPTSLTTCSHIHRPYDAYCGGWGFRYLNMLRFIGAARFGRTASTTTGLGAPQQESMQIAIRKPSRTVPVQSGEPFEIQSTVAGTCTGFVGVAYYVDGIFLTFQASNSSDFYPGAQLLNNITATVMSMGTSPLSLHLLKAVAMKERDGHREPCPTYTPNGEVQLMLKAGEASQEIEFSMTHTVMTTMKKKK